MLFYYVKIAEKNNDLKAIYKIARKNPLFIPAVQIVVHNSVNNGDKSKALSVINRALKQKKLPIEGKLFFLKQRARVYSMFNDAKNAQKDLDSIKQIDSRLVPETMFLQARVWALQNKNLEDAYSYVMTLIKMNTSDVAAWDLLSVIIEKKEGIENALEILERVGEVTPSSSIYEHLGDFYKKQGDIDRAKKAYSRALDVANDGLIVVPLVQKKLRKLK